MSSLRHRDPYGQRPQLDADALGVWAREKMRLQITHLATTVATRGRSLVVVVTPAADAVAPIVDAIEETGIPVIRAFPPDRPDTTFPVDRHLTPLGNRLVAATVAGELVSRGLVRPAAVTRPTDSARDTMAGGRRPDGRAGR
jgi:ABC-type sugar transport system substrate-binding protein